MKQWKIEQVTVEAYASREGMGQAAAQRLAEAIRTTLREKETAAVVFASAPSQNEFLRSLRTMDSVAWERIRCYHLDEYVGLPTEAPQSFAAYLRTELFAFRTPLEFYTLNGLNDPEAECARYTELLERHPIDIACIGIGENGHIAFNDPHVADFDDPVRIKKVELDETSRKQQVNDGCFPQLDAVPREALTLTIPSIVSASHIICTVPGERKSDAVHRTLFGPVDSACPASILRRSARCDMFLDFASASRIAAQ
ncbi:glucosamine-6-phosphate deaminase [Paenibacillus ehimensis]|uniref:glucosamine-6-phosphate deaminase n=1 Tax=Paenibacillus ehimensis TaxID=79264 RepID=UPI00055A4F05|nr:glucosamine-6-phosphate deaminase [Paenibacillus ehimensis]